MYMAAGWGVCILMCFTWREPETLNILKQVWVANAPASEVLGEVDPDLPLPLSPFSLLLLERGQPALCSRRIQRSHAFRVGLGQGDQGGG